MKQVVAQVATVTTSGGAETVKSGEAKFYGGIIRADGTNDVTVTVGDDTTTKMTLKLDTTLNGLMKVVNLPVPIKMTDSLKITVAGTGGEFDCLYSA